LSCGPNWSAVRKCFGRSASGRMRSTSVSAMWRNAGRFFTNIGFPLLRKMLAATTDVRWNTFARPAKRLSKRCLKGKVGYEGRGRSSLGIFVGGFRDQWRHFVHQLVGESVVDCGVAVRSVLGAVFL